MEIKLKDLNVYYEIAGEGKPIVMLHGYYPDHRLMSGCMEPIFKNRNGFQRIYLDLPGMGKTKAKEWIINSDIMLNIVMEFVEKVVSKDNFLLIGESYGGYLARGIVHEMADRVDGLMLLCPCIVADSSKRNNPVHEVLKRDEQLLSGINKPDAEDFDSMAVVQNEEIWQRYEEEILSGVKIADDNFLKKLKNTGYEFTFDVDKMNEKYEKPTLMLLGRQDSSVGYKDAFNILDNYPRATYAALDLAGHNLQLEQRDLFNCLVNEWLDRVEDEV